MNTKINTTEFKTQTGYTPTNQFGAWTFGVSKDAELNDTSNITVTGAYRVASAMARQMAQPGTTLYLLTR